MYFLSNEYYTNFNKEQKSQKLSNYTITRKCFLKFIIIYDDKNRSRNVSSIDEREHARFSKGGILWHEGIKEREKKKKKIRKRWKRAVVRSWQRFASARITTRKNGEGTIPINLSVSQKETMFPLSFRGAAMRRNRNYTRNHPWLPREDPGLLTTFALAIFYTSNSLP